MMKNRALLSYNGKYIHDEEQGIAELQRQITHDEEQGIAELQRQITHMYEQLFYPIYILLLGIATKHNFILLNLYFP